MQDIRHQLYTSTAQFPQDWDDPTLPGVFLSQPYLKALECAAPDNLTPFFIGFFRDDKLLGKALCQFLHLEANEIFRENRQKGAKRIAKKAVKSVLKANVLVLGNMLHTGQHAYRFSDELDENAAQKALAIALTELKKQVKKSHGTVHLEVNKDFLDTDFESLKKRKRLKSHHDFQVQPNMVLPIREAWKVFPDYLQSMTTKYRTRYKRARKKLGDDCQRKDLTLSELQGLVHEMYALYKCVSDGAGFNTFVLPQNHFVELKKNLGDEIAITGYFQNHVLIGFTTLLHNQTNLEAYFLGYDSAVQYDQQLYLNMLYDMVEAAIQGGYKKLIFARTAMEIKSSVGAEPVDMYGFIKHRHQLGNRILKSIFHLLQPEEEWTQRNPFKEGV